MPKEISERELQEKVVIQSETKEPKEAYYGSPFTTDMVLSGKEKKDIGEDVVDEIKRSIDESQPFFDSIEKWNNLYEGQLPEKNRPWPGCSNTNVPVSTVRLDGIANKLEQAICEVLPNFKVESELLEDDKIEAVEKLIQKRIDGKGIKFKIFTEQILLNAGKQRTGIGVLRWNKDIKRRRAMEFYRDEIDPETGAVIVSALDQFKEVYKTAKAAGVSQEVYSEIIRNLKNNGQEKIQVEYNKVEEYPKLEIINRDDFILVPSNARSIEEARGKFKRTWITYQDLLRGVKKGIYEKEDVDLLKRKVGENAIKDKKQDQHISKQGQSKEDVSQIHTLGKEGREMFVGIWEYDKDDGEIAEDILVTVDLDTGVVIRSNAYPYWNGEPYFYDVKMKSRVNQFDGVSIVERLAPIQYEINTQHNQRVDAWTQILNKIYLKDEAVTMRPDPTHVKLKPGMVINVEGAIGGVQNALQELVKLPTGVPNFAQEEQLLLQYSDEVVGYTTLMTGQNSPTDPSAPATKTIALLREASVHIGAYVRHVKEGLNRIARGVLWLEHQFGPDEQEIDGVTLLKQDINPDSMEISVRASDNNLNQALEEQTALFMLQTLMGIPQVQQNQLAVSELIKNFVKKARYDGDRDILSLSPDQLMEIMYQRFEEMQQQQEAEAAQQQEEAAGAHIDEQASEIGRELGADPDTVRQAQEELKAGV